MTKEKNILVFKLDNIKDDLDMTSKKFMKGEDELTYLREENATLKADFHRLSASLEKVTAKYDKLKVLSTANSMPEIERYKGMLSEYKTRITSLENEVTQTRRQN